MSKRIKKAALHAVHATVNPTKLLDKDFAQKVAKDAQSGFGVLPDKYAKIAGQVAPIVTAFIPGVGPLISAGITAANNFANTGQLGSSLLKGGLSYVGGNVGKGLGEASSLGSQTIGNALGMAGNTFGEGIASIGSSSLGGITSNILGANLGGTLGSFAGGQLGENVAAAVSPSFAESEDPTNFQAYRPSQQAANDLPPSLQGFGGLNPAQQSSNIANQGVYGGGLGKDEQTYFTNLINRRLVDPGGNTQNISSLSPIEGSYLQKLGLGGYGNSNDLLQAISKWQAA